MDATNCGQPVFGVGARCENRGGPEVLAHLQSGPDRHYLGCEAVMAVSKRTRYRVPSRVEVGA